MRASGFLNVSSVSGSCPIFSANVPYLGTSIVLDVQCSSEVDGFKVAGIILMIVCAWVAFRIVFVMGVYYGRLAFKYN